MDDHNDFLTLLDKAIRILCFISERLHGNNDSPEPDGLTCQSENEKTLFFPSLRADTFDHTQKGFSLTISDEEISKMPRYFRKIFRTNHRTAHVRLKDSGVYEIRIQIDGRRISGSGKYLEDAKANFIDKLRKAAAEEKDTPKTKLVAPQVLPAAFSLSVGDYALQYLDTFKRPNVSEKHYNNLCGIVRRLFFR